MTEPPLLPVSSDGAPPAIGPYSQAVEAGGFLFLSGQIALDEEGEGPDGDASAQAAQVLENLDAVLRAGGVDRTRVVKTSLYLTDLEDFTAVNGVYEVFFGDHRPARVCVEVSALPRKARVEMDFIALAN
jgi:2-iminobutanoate/2-iminopropanoate deaminase